MALVAPYRKETTVRSSINPSFLSYNYMRKYLALIHFGASRWDMIQDQKNTYKDMDRMVAYGKAWKTWANWVNSNVDSSKTKIFVQGISPDHDMK